MVSFNRSKSRGWFGPDLISRLMGRAHCSFSLCQTPLSIRSLEHPAILRFFLGAGSEQTMKSAVGDADEVKAGQRLALWGDTPCLPSPVDGKAKMELSTPDVRGGKPGRAIRIEPNPGRMPDALQPLDAGTVSIEDLLERFWSTGIFCRTSYPDWDTQQIGSRSVVISTLDPEPGVCVAASLMEERKADIGKALSLLGRWVGKQKLFLAVSEHTNKTIHENCREIPARIIEIKPVYPQALPAMLAMRIRDSNTLVVSLESALAALDSVELGVVRSYKTLSLIRTGRQPSDVIRVVLGTPISDIVRQCGLQVGEADKIIAGGPMRGYAQYSLDAAVDANIDAITVVRADELVACGNDPCIRCGACIDVCPMGLQAQSIGLFSEFGKFEVTRNYGIEHCIECGLCASVCTARRPLLQLIRLAKQQLAQAGRDAG